MIPEHAISPARTGLSPIQVRILQYIAEGFTSREIGRAIHLSEDSVKLHASQLIRRLAAKNRPHAVAIAFRRNILKRGQP